MKIRRSNGDSRKETALLERKLAKKALNDENPEFAWQHLKNALIELSSLTGDAECFKEFITSALEFSNLCFTLGKGFKDSVLFLTTARFATEQFGDRRSQALIFMHLGRFYFFTERRRKALRLLTKGKSEIEDLGDEDIFSQSAEFLGFYYFIQGLFNEALPHFERAAMSYESNRKGIFINPSGIISLAFCNAHLGRFHLALGTLDYYQRLAKERTDKSLGTTIRAVTGFVLLMINKKEEAFYHLNAAYADAKKNKNDLALFLVYGYLSYHALLDGRPNDSWELLLENMKQMPETGLYFNYETSFFLEHYYEFIRQGFKPDQVPSLVDFINRTLRRQNIHMSGVAYRLRAMYNFANNGHCQSCEKDLKSSENLLLRSGDPIQLAKTRLELARLKLKENDKDQARFYAKKAWHGFSGYEDVFFPDNMRYLLSVNDPEQANQERNNELKEKFISMIQELTPSADLNVLMTRTVAATNRFFGAERGGLFWFGNNNGNRAPVFQGAYNLTKGEVFSDEFKSNLALVFKSFREKKPYVVRMEGKCLLPHSVRAILCLPITSAGQIRGVLYHDNSYVKDCFDYLEKSLLTGLGNALSTYIERIYKFSRNMERSNLEKLHPQNYKEHSKIVFKCNIMERLLEEVDHVASSDSNILLLGETGVGKELLARRIHYMSLHSKGPLVIVDSPTIPEELFESELFGHEKGAFTGADRRKAGHLELAHGGTLFIDEIGEIPQPLQVKLLRVLQDKKIRRVGGTQTISSDFRLVASTNRDLTVEVSMGRFREDLYFRLNVVPITLPPLRDRMEDLPLLVNHFLSIYSAKYNRSQLELTKEDEAKLMDYHWPGNIRELQNIIERAVILSRDGELVIDVPIEKPTNAQRFYNDHPSLDELNRRYIRYAIEKTGGKIGGRNGASEFLGIKRTTLQNRMKKLGIQ